MWGWGGLVFRATMIWLWFKLPFCLFGHTKPGTSVIYEKAKFASFIYMQPQKVKGALAIRRIFSLVDMITKLKFSNCPNVFEIGLFR